MEQTISSDGAVIAFFRSGVGRPLLLVHGSTADHRRWATISPHFEQHFTVYAMDRRGRKGSFNSEKFASLQVPTKKAYSDFGSLENIFGSAKLRHLAA
ncbi:hypothetical protein L0337_10425 [candidate division KSB1 bacterium]|nr:hypothetical protein [candidate division KSB1 bacterium]